MSSTQGMLSSHNAHPNFSKTFALPKCPFHPLLHLIQCIKMPLRISQPGRLQSSIGPIGSRLIGLPGLPIDWAPWAPISPPPPSGLPGLPTPPISAGLPKLVGLPLLPNRNFEAMGAQLISGAQQILMVLGAQGAREPRTMKCTKAPKP